MSHGDENPTPADKTTHVRPNGRVRQPDTGPVPAIAPDPNGNGKRQPADDLERLEEYRPSAGGGDAQHRPGIHEPGSPADQSGNLEDIQVLLEQQQWSGPLPPPAALYQYEQVQPGLAERIVAMAETAATGEIKTQDRLATAEIERAQSGQAMAFVLTLIAIGAAIYFFVVHNPIAGAAFLSFPVLMLVRSFLTGIGSDLRRNENGHEADPAKKNTPE